MGQFLSQLIVQIIFYILFYLGVFGGIEGCINVLKFYTWFVFLFMIITFIAIITMKDEINKIQTSNWLSTSQGQ
jgi:hypothetical protein